MIKQNLNIYVQIYKSEICIYTESIENCYSRDLIMDQKVIIKWWWWIYLVLIGDTTATRPKFRVGVGTLRATSRCLIPY
jgi:hypothetical protein